MKPRHTTSVRSTATWQYCQTNLKRSKKKIVAYFCSEFCNNHATPRDVDSHASCLRPAALVPFLPAVQAIKLLLILQQAFLTDRQ